MPYTVPVTITCVCLGSLLTTVFAALNCDSNSPLCLEPQGQFPVPNECKKFANCWDSCASLSSCPGTLVFSGETNRCAFTWDLSPSNACYRPMSNLGGNLPGLAPLPPLPELPPINAFGGSMQQGLNQDGPLFQHMSKRSASN